MAGSRPNPGRTGPQGHVYGSDLALRQAGRNRLLAWWVGYPVDEVVGELQILKGVAHGLTRLKVDSAYQSDVQRVSDIVEVIRNHPDARCGGWRVKAVGLIGDGVKILQLDNRSLRIVASIEIKRVILGKFQSLRASDRGHRLNGIPLRVREHN